MKNATWMEVFFVFGIVAIVGSLIFVGLQIRESQRIATAEYYQQQALAARENAELALLHSDLVAKANRGETLTDADSFVLNKYVISQWQSAFFSRRRSEYLDRPLAGAVKNFSDFLCNNPGLKTFWNKQSIDLRVVGESPPANFAIQVNAIIDKRCAQ